MLCKSVSVSWEIEYKIVSSNRIYKMKIDLHFNKIKNITKWFKMTHIGKNCEFINAKIIEKNV